jgi:hypothetical protein
MRISEETEFKTGPSSWSCPDADATVSIAACKESCGHKRAASEADWLGRNWSQFWDGRVGAFRSRRFLSREGFLTLLSRLISADFGLLWKEMERTMKKWKFRDNNQ